MKKIMKEKNQVVPDEVLSKEFLSQFKTESSIPHIFLIPFIFRFLWTEALSRTTTVFFSTLKENLSR